MADPSIGGFRALNTGEQVTANYVWDTNTLAWVPMTSSGGGVGSNVVVTNASIPVTQAGTWNVNTTDTHTTAVAPLSVRLTDGSSFYSAGGGNVTLTTAAKGSTTLGYPTSENTDVNTQSLHVKMVNTTMPVTGTFWQATQPVSVAATLNVSDAHTTAAAPLAVRLTDGSSFYTVTNPLSTSAKGATSAGGPTSENTSADIQSLHARITNTSLAVTGSFWQATQPVSLASLPTLATGTNTIGSIKLTDGTSTATIGNLTNNKALATMIVDGTGNQITSFGGGTQYTNGTTQATPVGTVSMAKNASNVISALSLDGSGNLNVNLAAGTITGGNAAASATGSAVPASAGYTGFNNGGTLVGVSSANPLPVSGGIQLPTTQATGTLTASAQTVTFSGALTPEIHVIVYGTFNGTVIAEASADNANWSTASSYDNSWASGSKTLNMTNSWSQDEFINPVSFRYFRVRCSAYTSGTANVVITSPQSSSHPLTNSWSSSMAIGDYDTSGLTATVKAASTAAVAGDGSLVVALHPSSPTPTGSNTIGNVGGTAAAGATISGNPNRVGGTARTANPTAVTDGQVSNIMTDKMGRQVVVQGHVRELVGKQATTITSSVAATTVVSAGGASVFTDITSLTVTNSSATATLVTLSDGTTSMVYNVPGGGGFTMPFNPPMPATTANTAWTLTCGTSVASVYCNIVYAKNL